MATMVSVINGRTCRTCSTCGTRWRYSDGHECVLCSRMVVFKYDPAPPRNTPPKGPPAIGTVSRMWWDLLRRSNSRSWCNSNEEQDDDDER
jgi:hypothetical protein